MAQPWCETCSLHGLLCVGDTVTPIEVETLSGYALTCSVQWCRMDGEV